MSNVIYFNSLRGKKSKYGIRISGKVEEVIEEIRKHANEKGYINLELKERQSEGKYGQTHYMIVDTYTGRDEQPREQPREQPAPPAPASQQGWNAPSEDDLPF